MRSPLVFDSHERTRQCRGFAGDGDGPAIGSELTVARDQPLNEVTPNPHDERDGEERQDVVVARIATTPAAVTHEHRVADDEVGKRPEEANDRKNHRIPIFDMRKFVGQHCIEFITAQQVE